MVSNDLQIIRDQRIMTEILQNRILLLTVAYITDLLLGDPRSLWHPVRGIGWLISKTEGFLQRRIGFRLPETSGVNAKKDRDPNLERAAGILEVMIVLFLCVAAFILIRSLLERIHPALCRLFLLILCWQLLACRSLKDAAMEVYVPVSVCDLPAARQAVSMIVGRDADQLDQTGIIKAAVETVAENTTDGIIAPLFYLALSGPCGMLFYKAVNTMDSMIAYRNVRYRYFGTAAARLDDALNYIPSRLGAVLMIVASAVLHLFGQKSFDPGNAFRIWKRDRRKHASPNSAQTEAVCAGALGIQLAGDARYFGELHHKPVLGDPGRDPDPGDIPKACRLMTVTAVLTVLLLVILLGAVLMMTPGTC